MLAVIETQPISPVTPSAWRLRPFSVSEYEFLTANGILSELDNVELLNGGIVEKMPKGVRHAALNDWLGEELRDLVSRRAVVRYQNPIRLDDFSQPEPDLVLVRPPREQYLNRHPTPADILLIIEISDTTLRYDREEKSLAYARADLPQYLIINLKNDTVEDYRQPSPDGYLAKQTHRFGETFNLVEFPELTLAITC